MKFFMFVFLAGCAVKCDDGGNYYVIEMPEPSPTTSKSTTVSTSPPTTSETTTLPTTSYTTSTVTAPPKHNHNRLQVYWNVPTNQCRSKRIPFENLQKFGIIQNDKDDFRGDKIVIFYDPGLFPAIFQNQTSGKLRYRNGGVPQEGDLEEHLESFRSVVNQTIPDPNFGGIAIIDFESWRPIFRQNWGEIQLYKEVSYKIEKKRHWFWPDKWIHYEAKERFEKAARIFMQNTISLAKQMRPHAVWGYYGFPYCFNMAGDHMTESCAKGVEGENDQVYWLWLESTALYPSVYSSNALSSTQLGKMIRGRIREAARVRRSNTPILPYFWFRYREGGFLHEVDLHTALQTFNQSEASGFIIWGSSNDVNTVEKCQNLHDYIYKVFGPAITKYAKDSERLEDEIDIMNDMKLENVTTTTNVDSTTTEITSSTTDSTTYVTDEDFDISTVTTEEADETLSDLSEEDETVAMKSLIDILLNQIFNGDGAEFNETLTDSLNTTSDSKIVENMEQSSVCNFSKTTEIGQDMLSKDAKKGKPKNKTTLVKATEVNTETPTEKLQTITVDDWTTLIFESFEENVTHTLSTKSPTDTTVSSYTESVSHSTKDYLPIGIISNVDSATDNIDNISKESINGKPNRKKEITTQSFPTETYPTSSKRSDLDDLSSTTVDSSTYLGSHFVENFDYSANTKNPTILTNSGAETFITESTTQNAIEVENIPTEPSIYAEIFKNDFSKKFENGKPKNRTGLSPTEDSMAEDTTTETYTENVPHSIIEDTISSVTEGSTYSYLSKDAKKGKPKHRTDNIKNNKADESNYIFFNQNTLLNQEFGENFKFNEGVTVSDSKIQSLKNLKKGAPKKVLSKEETSNSVSNVTEFNGKENDYINTEVTIQEDQSNEDNNNKNRSTNIHESTFTVTSPPESLTSGTSEQVTGSAPISRPKYIFCLIFYFSVSKCLCDYYGQC